VLRSQVSVGKVIQKNRLDATITIHWSPRSAQHVSGNLLPIFRSVRLRILQHMVQCPVVVGRGSESRHMALRVRYEGSSYRTRSARCGCPNPCLPQQQDTIPYAVKITVLRSWRWAKVCPKHVELILEINKLLLLHLVGFSILLYLHWWCTVKHKSSQFFVYRQLNTSLF